MADVMVGIFVFGTGIAETDNNLEVHHFIALQNPFLYN